MAKNAAANLIRGGTAGIVAVFLPAILVRHMAQAEYSAWVLVLQVSAYSTYLDFGLQTAVGRYIAIADEKEDSHQRDSVFTTAFVGLLIASMIAIASLLAIACTVGMLFPKVPASLLPSMRAALLIVGSSIALGLPSSAWCGVFIGLQRNELVAAVIGTTRLSSALALVLAALHGASIIGMAVIVAGINLASYLSLYLLVNRFSKVTFRLDLVKRSVARDLVGYCFSLTVWSFSTLLVSGLDILFVGRFEFGALIPYALATSLVNFIVGVQTAIFGAMMPHAAVLHARGDSARLGAMVISATQLALLLLLLTGLPIAIFAGPLIRIWVGNQYVVEGFKLLVVLVTANIIRLTGMPYSVVLVASGQQKLVTLSPLSEGLTNLAASIFLGMRFGAIGVAAGTLIGGIVGLLGHIVYNMPRTRNEASFRIRAFLFSGMGLPLVAAAPLIALLIYTSCVAIPGFRVIAAVCGITLLQATLMLLYSKRGTAPEEVVLRIES
ncbi:MAG TPA: hypothetical protein VGF96_13655 [Terracidiphilus sp.]